MAKALTAVQSRTKPKETISFPILTYTDALPRNDLQDLSEVSQRPERTATEQWDFSQPPVGDGWIRKPPPAQGAVQCATFDFRLTAPPDEAVQSNSRPSHLPIEENMIGIALGSPSMVGKNAPLPPPRFNTAIFASERELPPRPSKWKKIGGFFKAKNAFSLLPDGTPESDDQSQSNDDKSQDKLCKTKERNQATEEWPKIELTPPKMPAQRARNFSLSGNHSKDQQSKQGVLLSVNIPDVQMERYSVMFGNVVTKNERPSLLARRAKTLDKLSVPDAIGFLKSPTPPPMPQRRATSPAQSSFNVFPTSQPSKAAEMLGTQNFSRRPGPLVRANTLPIDSPSKKLPPPPHHAATMGSISSFESPVIPKLFSESSGIPRTASGYDKPLPAIKPEPEPEPVELQQSHMPKSNATSPQNIKPQQSVQALDIVVSSPEPQPDQSQENVRPQNDKLRSLNVSSQENVKAQAGAVAKPDSQPTELQKDVHKPTQAPQETHSQQTVEPQHVATSQTEEQPSRSQQGVRPQKNTPSPQRVRPQANIQTHSNGIVKAEPQPIESRKNVRPQKGTAPLGNMPPRQSSLSHKIVGTAPSKPRQPVFQPRKDSLPQTTQSQAHAPLPPPKNPQRQHNKQMGDHTPNHPSRPRLRVQTQGRPHPPTKDTPSSSTLLSASSRSHSTPDRIDRIMTPLSASTGPKSGISPADSTRMPFVDAVETLDNAKEEPQPEPEAERPIPKVEVSIARSVSVSRAKRQIIVPIGERIDHLDPDERFVQRRPMTPQITDAHRGHRPGVSQDVRIECL